MSAALLLSAKPSKKTLYKDRVRSLLRLPTSLKIPMTSKMLLLFWPFVLKLITCDYMAAVVRPVHINSDRQREDFSSHLDSFCKLGKRIKCSP